MSDHKHEAHHRLVRKLQRQLEDVERLTANLEERELSRRVKENQWSLKELVCHLWRMQDVFAARIEAMLSHEEPPIMRYDPDTDEGFAAAMESDTSHMLEQMRQGRATLCARLEQLDGAGWHRKGKHPDFERCDVHFQAEYMAHHEAHHIYQMFQRRQAFGGKIPH
jgi:hypothetical protein